MILKGLYDYYKMCGNLPIQGMEEKEIGFIIVLSTDGNFLRFEDCRIDNKRAKSFLVKKNIGRSSGVVANYLYDKISYVLGYYDNKSSDKEDKVIAQFNAFKNKISALLNEFPNNQDLKAINSFYKQSREGILKVISQDPLWEEIKKNLSRKYSIFSFRIEGEPQIVAEKKELLQLDNNHTDTKFSEICLVTGILGQIVETTTATMIPGSQAMAKLVSFQVNSGYDSYGKTKCFNAPISTDAEFAYTTALNAMLGKESHNKFLVGNRTFLFWTSTKTETTEQAEESLFNLLGVTEGKTDDPNAKTEQAKKVFKAIYTGYLKTNLEDRFYILGLAPNSARIAAVYWQETSLKDFAGLILRHFDDMTIIDNRIDKKPYMGVKDILSAVTLSGKQSEATPNLPEAVIKSIFQGTQYPFSLFSACLRRLRAESSDKGAIRICRIAILKAYLNRLNDNNKKIKIMLDKENTNQGYLCGRLFAVLDKIQEDANGINSIRERYMSAASSTPASVFSTILNLSSHHMENLSNDGTRIFYEKIKQEIFDKITADGFPAHLDLQDQGRFFIGYYHQRQDFFTKKDNENK